MPPCQTTILTAWATQTTPNTLIPTAQKATCQTLTSPPAFLSKNLTLPRLNLRCHQKIHPSLFSSNRSQRAHLCLRSPTSSPRKPTRRSQKAPRARCQTQTCSSHVPTGRLKSPQMTTRKRCWTKISSPHALQRSECKRVLSSLDLSRKFSARILSSMWTSSWRMEPCPSHPTASSSQPRCRRTSDTRRVALSAASASRPRRIRAHSPLKIFVSHPWEAQKESAAPSPSEPLVSDSYKYKT